MFDDFMTVDMLTTFTGITLAVILIVQFTKSLIKKKFGDSIVRLYSFIISILLVFIFNNTGFTAQGIITTLINAMIITVAATGGYEMIADPMAQSIRKK